MSKCALVTGGCGNIGSYVVDALLDRGYDVIVLDPAPPLVHWVDEIAKDRLIYRHGVTSDLRQIMALKEEYEIDEIYDFAGILGSEELTSRFESALFHNVNGARNLFELAKMIGAKVYHINIEFAGYGFTDAYSVSKEMALRLAIEYVKKYGVEIVSSYVHHIFCERQKLMPVRKIIPTLVAYAVTGSRFRIFGNPRKMMDLLYARDFAEVVIDLLNHDEVQTVDKHIYDIGVGYGVELEDLVKYVYELAGNEPNYVVMEDFRKQRPDPYRIAKNDWEEILGKRNLSGVKEKMGYVLEKYKEQYSMDEFRLAVEIYEQRHRFVQNGV